MDMLSQQFASDNYSGVCPEVWAAMEAANAGHQRAYGDDEWTMRASEQFRKLFEIECDVFFVFNGTAANSLALSSLCQSYHSVICADTAHIETDECGAPEFFSRESPNKPSVMRESPQHLIRAAHEPDELFRL
jgi:threonine aldolase